MDQLLQDYKLSKYNQDEKHNVDFSVNISKFELISM